MSQQNAVISGAKWTTSATIISTILQFLQMLIVARILSPASFGIVSISTIFINFFNIFVDLGFSNSIIAKQEVDRKNLSTIFFLNIILGVIIFFIIYLLSPLIANFYNNDRLIKVVRTASLFFLFIYYGHIYGLLLIKELQFKDSAIVDITSAIIGSFATMFFAYGGFEEMALIYGQLCLYLTKTLLQILFGLKYFIPVIYFNINKIMDHVKFGFYNLGDGLLGFASSNLDFLIIGRLLGTQQLGYYTIAFQLAVFPITRLNPIILKIAYPIFAKMQATGADLKHAYIKVLDITSFANFPLIAGLFITAESIVPIFYGSKWSPSIPLVHILIFVSFVSCLSHPLFILAYSKNKPNYLFYLNLIIIIIQWPILYLFSYYWQTKGVAFGYLFVSIIGLFANFYIVHILVGNFISILLRTIYKQVLFCLFMVCGVYIYKYYFNNIDKINLTGEIILGGIIYITLILKYKFSYSDLKSLKISKD